MGQDPYYDGLLAPRRHLALIVATAEHYGIRDVGVAEESAKLLAAMISKKARARGALCLGKRDSISHLMRNR